MFIGVIGGRVCSQKVAQMAEAVGRELARRGAVLVCGGLGGVMEAACRGAVAEGGITVGVLPGDRRSDANPYVKIPIVTGLGYSRNVIVVMSSEALIAVDGGFGTLSEIGHALQFKLPVVGLGTWGLTRNQEPDTSIIVAHDPVDAVDKATAAAEARRAMPRHTKRRRG